MLCMISMRPFFYIDHESMDPQPSTSTGGWTSSSASTNGTLRNLPSPVPLQCPDDIFDTRSIAIVAPHRLPTPEPPAPEIITLPPSPELITIPSTPEPEQMPLSVNDPPPHIPNAEPILTFDAPIDDGPIIIDLPQTPDIPVLSEPTQFFPSPAFTSVTSYHGECRYANAFRPNPTFPHLCLICGGKHHLEINCRYKTEATLGARICHYPFCRTIAHRPLHAIKVCPVLHHICQACRCRGHLEDQCEDIMHCARDVFEQFADLGEHTSNRQDFPPYGFYKIKDFHGPPCYNCYDPTTHLHDHGGFPLYGALIRLKAHNRTYINYILDFHRIMYIKNNIRRGCQPILTYDEDDKDDITFTLDRPPPPY